MQKQVQLTGERKWWGSDWIMIQNEIWKVMEGWLGQYGQACILSGCVVTANGGNWDISAGILLIKDAGGVYQYAQFAGATAVTLPGYLVISTANTNILYEDGNSKAKITTNTAVFTNSAPGGGVDYVAMNNSGNKTWKEATGLNTLLPEAWRVVGAGGQPAYGSAFTGSATALKFRKDNAGFVEVSGVVDVTVTGDNTVFTLPVGYRPEILKILYVAGAASKPFQINTDGVVSFENGSSTAGTAAIYFLYRL